MGSLYRSGSIMLYFLIYTMIPLYNLVIYKKKLETSVAGEFFLCFLCRSGSILPDLHNDPTVYLQLSN